MDRPDPMPAIDPSERVLAFVTFGAPTPQITRVVAYFAAQARTHTAQAQPQR